MALNRFGAPLPTAPPTVRVFPERDQMSEQTFHADDVTNKPIKNAVELPAFVTYEADDITGGPIKNAPPLPAETVAVFDGVAEEKVVKSSESKTVKKARSK